MLLQSRPAPARYYRIAVLERRLIARPDEGGLRSSDSDRSAAPILPTREFTWCARLPHRPGPRLRRGYRDAQEHGCRKPCAERTRPGHRRRGQKCRRRHRHHAVSGRAGLDDAQPRRHRADHRGAHARSAHGQPGGLEVRIPDDALASLAEASAIQLGFPHEFLARPTTRNNMLATSSSRPADRESRPSRSAPCFSSRTPQDTTVPRQVQVLSRQGADFTRNRVTAEFVRSSCLNSLLARRRPGRATSGRLYARANPANGRHA